MTRLHDDSAGLTLNAQTSYTGLTAFNTPTTMNRRSILMSGASMVFCGCAPRGLVTGVSYHETITALAATPDWKTVIVFGKEYDYEFTPSKALITLLTGPMRPRLTANFGSGHLQEDSTLELSILLTIADKDRTPEEKENRALLGSNGIPYQENLRLRRVKRTENPERLGVQRTNHPYDISIYGDVAPGTSAPRKVFNGVIDSAAAIVLIPIVIFAVGMGESRRR